MGYWINKEWRKIRLIHSWSQTESWIIIYASNTEILEIKFGSKKMEETVENE